MGSYEEFLAERDAIESECLVDPPEQDEDTSAEGWLTWQKLMGSEPPSFPAVLENPDALTEGTGDE